MRFHGNQLSWAIKHLFISLCFKYHFPGFFLYFTMLAPVISSLDEIYCTLSHFKLFQSAPPPKSAPPIFFSVLHFSEEIWTEILSKMMKL